MGDFIKVTDRLSIRKSEIIAIDTTVENEKLYTHITLIGNVVLKVKMSEFSNKFNKFYHDCFEEY